MRRLVSYFTFIAIMLFSLNSYAQLTGNDAAEIALATEIAAALGLDAPTTAEEAQAIIANADAGVVTAAVTAVAGRTTDPAVKADIAAAAARNNTGVTPALMASAAGADVDAVASNMGAGQGSSPTGTPGNRGRGTGARTGTGNAGGGALASDDATDLLVALGVDSATALAIVNAANQGTTSL